ncbi:MAG TPA: Calx-beta domain-containing protein [Pyrinomonadaceae bacterium]|nr:Calx-beta domain-containing protein [Pyrinomonadaceae bacterium]
MKRTHVFGSPKAVEFTRASSKLTNLRSGALLILAVLVISVRTAEAQCPAVGSDTNCGVIITVTDTGASLSLTGQPPYDDIEDTLIGVVNNSNLPIHSLGLNASLTIFAFDGDGIDTYGIPGNSMDSTGYGGPNAYFTNIDPSQRSGIVNFIVPIAAHGGTAYFSLEEAISSVTACSSLINNSLSGPTLSGGGLLTGSTTISANFTPKLNNTLSQAAQICGFTDFDWVQTITRLPDPSPFSARNNGSPYHLTSGSTPFNDPPAGGGYTYEPNPDNSYPFYYDAFSGELSGHKTATTLSFSDAPADPCLAGPLGLPSLAWLTNSSVRALCGNSISARGSSLGFTTHLAGVLPNGAAQDLGIGFTWTDNYNGTFGGIATTKNGSPVDPNSGEGSITVLSVEETTNFNGVIITTVNGNTVSPSLTVNDVSINEPSSGSANAVFNVTLSASSAQTVLVDFFTSNGTATAPLDYQSVNGTLTFAPGQTTRTITVPVNSDDVVSGNESFFVNLSNPNNANLGRAQGEGTIVDDDGVSILQFVTPATSAFETEDAGTVTVVRTGDTSGVASVRFETSDLTAHQSSRYSFTSGTLKFAPGETTKNIKIPLVNGTLVDGNQSFQITLSNPSSGSGIGNPANIVVTVIDDDTAPTSTNPVDGAEFFVRQHYLDFLGREPDSAGLSFWTSQITSCGTDPVCISDRRVMVSAAFFFSIEYQETGGFVSRISRVAFGRQSTDPSTRLSYLRFMRDMRQVGQDVIVGQTGFDTLLEENKQAYAQQVVANPAFTLRFPIQPGPAYVDALYASAAITPTTAERQAALDAFGVGGTTGRVAALRFLADSNSARQADFRGSFVLAQYHGYLRRGPMDAPEFSDAGYKFWLNKLNAFNGDFRAAEMVKAFILSAEYRQRFGQP